MAQFVFHLRMLVLARLLLFCGSGCVKQLKNRWEFSAIIPFLAEDFFAWYLRQLILEQLTSV